MGGRMAGHRSGFLQGAGRALTREGVGDRRRLKISVAIPVLNGEPYLSEMLQSIANQSRAPDQIVVSDQGSVDGSLRIARAFRADSPCEVILTTSSTKGPTANYLDALGRATGDLIAFCDQDDVWSRRRLELIEGAFLRRPEVSLVSTDSELVDRHLDSLGTTIRRGRRRSRRLAWKVSQGDDLSLFLHGLPLLAHTLTVHSICKPVALSRGAAFSSWWFESWIASLALCLGRLELVPEALTLYRQHERQAVGMAGKSLRAAYSADKISWISDRIRQLTFCRSLLLDDSRETLLDPPLRAFRLGILERNLHFLEKRREFLGSRHPRYRVPIGLLLDGSYSAFASGPWSFLSDTVLRQLLRHRPSISSELG